MSDWDILEAVESQDLAAVEELLNDDPALLRATDFEGRSPLFCAAIHGPDEIARYLLDQGADVNQATYSGYTPLMAAITNHRVDLAKLFVARGADVNARTGDSGASVLHMAADAGDSAMIEWLLAEHLDVNLSKNDGWTPLHTAAFKGNLDAVRSLMSAGADPQVEAYDGTTPVRAAELGYNSEVVEYLQAALAQSHTDALEPSREAPEDLFDAIMRGDEASALRWVKSGGALELDLDDNTSALQLALANNMYELADALLDANIDVNAQNVHGMTALHSAIVRRGDPDTMSMASKEGYDPAGLDRLISRIIDADADLERVRYEDDCTPLMLAASYGLHDVAQSLINAGADVKAVGTGGGALMRAAAEGNVEVVNLLIEHGAAVDETDESNQTPLLWASLNGNVDCAAALLQMGADPNIQSTSGFTGLMHACYKGYAEIVDLQLQHGADVSLQDSNGNGPREYAEIGGQNHIIPLLVKQPADEPTHSSSWLGRLFKRWR